MCLPEVPKQMMKEVEFLPCLECGGYAFAHFTICPLLSYPFSTCILFLLLVSPSLAESILRYLKFLDTNNLWMGRGGSKSVARALNQSQLISNRDQAVHVRVQTACIKSIYLYQVHYDDQDCRCTKRLAWIVPWFAVYQRLTGKLPGQHQLHDSRREALCVHAPILQGSL